MTTPVSDDVFDRVIVCAGLQSDVVARFVGADPSPKILPFRGEYWELKPERTDLVNGMIYPVPDPRFPFLGVHFTRGVYDNVHVGPNAVPALSREGYKWLQVSPKDTLESLAWPGAWPLAKQHWRMGVDEISGSLIKPLYFRKARRFIPELKQSTSRTRVQRACARRRGAAQASCSTTSRSTRSDRSLCCATRLRRPRRVRSRSPSTSSSTTSRRPRPSGPTP